MTTRTLERPKQKTAFGTELVLDLYGCNPRTIRSAKMLEKFVKQLCRRIEMKRYGEPLIEHFGHETPLTSGYSLVQLIETSCISGHFSELTNAAYLNIFSCKTFDADDAAAFCQTFFGAAKARRRLLVRK